MTLDLVVNNQIVSELGLVETTGRKVNANLLEVTPTNNFGYMVRRTTYMGYSFTLRLTRQDDTYDDLVTALVDAYHSQAALVFFTAIETIVNNGAVSQWRYSTGTVVPGSLGDFKGADRVDGLELEIHFSDRTKITGASNAPNFGTGPSL
jgi:hypothetical protein